MGTTSFLNKSKTWINIWSHVNFGIRFQNQFRFFWNFCEILPIKPPPPPLLSTQVSSNLLDFGCGLGIAGPIFLVQFWVKFFFNIDISVNIDEMSIFWWYFDDILLDRQYWGDRFFFYVLMSNPSIRQHVAWHIDVSNDI